MRNLFRKERAEKELDGELRAYVELVTDERIASGMTADEARRTALAEFGGMEQVKQAVRDKRAGAGLELFWRDLRFGFRQLVRNPGFTAAVVVTLALAIGANTAIFSIVNALLLRSLPYPHPERMGTIFARYSGSGDIAESRRSLDGEQWEGLRDNVPSLISGLSSGIASGVNLQAGQHVQYLLAGRVSEHYFDVLELRPLLGRTFTADEDRPHGSNAAVLSYSLWRNTFGSDPSIIGRAIRLKGDTYTVVGVLPASAHTPLDADVYTPLHASREGEGGGSNFEVITRLRDGATWPQADAELNHAWAERIARYLSRNPGGGVVYYSVPLQKGESAELRPQALALMMASGFILLIACANLAGLTLVRMARRSAEIATRMALGASAWQIQKQLWIENLVLALMGGAAGIGVGFVALRGLLSLLPRGFLPVTNIPLDGRVLGFTLAVTLLTSVLFGMLPALALRRADLRSSISSRGLVSGERLRLRQILIAGEMALSIVLLAGSGLLIRTLIHLETLPPGFNSNGVMAAKASLDDVRYHDQSSFVRLIDESLAAMRQIPGVKSAGMGLSLPYERALNGGVTLHDGPLAGKQVGTDQVYASPGYFETLEMPLLAGRTFRASDGPKTQPVAIVNQTFARKFLPGINPVGRTLDNGMMIVGVVSDVQLSSGLSPVAPLESEETMYFPAAQMDPGALAMVHAWFQPSWIVRTEGPVEGLTGQMQRALATVEPGLPFSGFYAMSDLRAQTLATQRIEVALLSAMAGLALLLSAVGIFGLVSSTVTQRTREIGIRIALGSTVSHAMARVAGSGAGAALVGLVVGLGLCAVTLRAMHSVLYGVGVYDPVSLGAVVATLLAITALASALPALRVARIDPARTLREE